MSSQAEPSWCRITSGDTAEATFRFTIDDFKNRPEKLKESVKSTCFKMNGPGDLKTKWQLKIYPKGRNESHEDYVGLSLVNESKFKVKAEYKKNIIDGAGKEKASYNCEARDYASCTPKRSFGWGKSKWVKREKLNDCPELLPDGNLTIKCTITVFGQEKVLSGVDSDSTNPNFSGDCQKQLCEDLGKVFSDNCSPILRSNVKGRLLTVTKPS